MNTYLLTFLPASLSGSRKIGKWSPTFLRNEPVVSPWPPWSEMDTQEKLVSLGLRFRFAIRLEIPLQPQSQPHSPMRSPVLKRIGGLFALIKYNFLIRSNLVFLHVWEATPTRKKPIPLPSLIWTCMPWLLGWSQESIPLGFWKEMHEEYSHQHCERMWEAWTVTILRKTDKWGVEKDIDSGAGGGEVAEKEKIKEPHEWWKQAKFTPVDSTATGLRPFMMAQTPSGASWLQDRFG